MTITKDILARAARAGGYELKPAGFDSDGAQLYMAKASGDHHWVVNWWPHLEPDQAALLAERCKLNICWAYNVVYWTDWVGQVKCGKVTWPEDCANWLEAVVIAASRAGEVVSE